MIRSTNNSNNLFKNAIERALKWKYVNETVRQPANKHRLLMQ